LPAVLALAGAAMLASAGCGQAFTGQRDLTVMLREYTGPDSAASAEQVKKQVAEAGLPDVFVVQGADVATVCAGHFTRLDEPKALEMMGKVRAITDVNGTHPFFHVKMIPTPEPTPPNPWPLTEAKGYFSLHVASWGTSGRMVKAQTYATQLRQQGYDAYVYHGPRLSMVTIGAFGMDVFEDPAQYGMPNTKPKIVNPVALELIRRFPRMRIEGEEATGPNGIPSVLVEIPGHRPPLVTARPESTVLYRVSLSMIDTHTGLADGRLTANGVAMYKDDIPTLIPALLKQVFAGMPVGREVRVGVAGVQPMDATASQEKVETIALQALVATLKEVGSGAAQESANATALHALVESARKAGLKITFVSPEETRQLLQAGGRTIEDVLLDPSTARGVKGLDFVCTGKVTSFER
jgi:hypothetical protein